MLKVDEDFSIKQPGNVSYNGRIVRSCFDHYSGTLRDECTVRAQ
ncbi:hypothetical protein BDE36_1868 [Arcticibacter tournemirensis]|nr:hypothetical protein BDE36_1868 [Arcticibacter tournemirensis]